MNILIMKTDALGDVLRTSFLAQALKEKYKHKKPVIYWITQKKAKAFFPNNPYVDKLVFVEDKSSLNALKNIEWDLIVNLEEGVENCKYISSLKSKELIGFFYNHGKILPTLTAKEWHDMSALGKKPFNDILKKENKKSHRQIMSEIVGIENYQKYEPFLNLAKEQTEIAENFIRKNNFSKQDLIVGINTGSSPRWSKQLPINKTVELIDKLHKNLNAKIVLFGGPSEKERNKIILEKSKIPIINTGTENNLKEFTALISVCNLFITSDTLGLHIALALKIKTITLLGPTSSAEIHLYGLGKKIITKSNCVCCYKKNCKSMEKIDVNEIMKNAQEILNPKVTILITSYKEPKTIGRAIESFINQKTNRKYELIISAPDEETLTVARTYAKKNKQIKIFRDDGKGKASAINQILPLIKSEIIILTDGDVYVSERSIDKIVELFEDEKVGCVTGKPVSTENRRTLLGYWSHMLCHSAHKLRLKRDNQKNFLECSGYLWAFRHNLIKKFPVDVAEDSIVPILFWLKDYKIRYAQEAEVYVSYPNSFKDFIKQKKRTIKSHEKINKYVKKKVPKMKTFLNEVSGIFYVLFYPSNAKEIFYSLYAIPIRAYLWVLAYSHYLRGKEYQDNWERVGSTK